MSGSREVQDAVGAAEHDADGEIARLQAELNEPSARELTQRRLAALEAERQRRRSAQLTAVAAKRLVGIQRADGSLADLEPQDDRRVLETTTARDAAVQTRNGRGDKRARLHREAQLLAAAFGLPRPELRDLQVPARSEMAADIANASAVELAGTLYLNAEPDHAELGDLPGRELLRQQAELELPAPSPVHIAPTLTPEDADVLASEAARIERRPPLTTRRRAGRRDATVAGSLRGGGGRPWKRATGRLYPPGHSRPSSDVRGRRWPRLLVRIRRAKVARLAAQARRP